MTDQLITRMKVYDRIMRPMAIRHDVNIYVNARAVSGTVTQWTPNYTVTPACAARLEQRR